MKNSLFAALGGMALLLAAAPAPAPTYHLLNTVAVGGEGGWDFLATDDLGGRLYLSHGSQVEVVDLKTRQVVGHIPNTPGVHGILPLPKLGRGYITCGRSNSVMVFDLKTLAPLATIPTGEGPDALLLDDFTGHIFVFNHRGGSATVIDPATNAVLGTVALGGDVEVGVADGKGTVFVNLEDKSEVVVIDAKTRTVRHRWPLAPGTEPTGLALDRKHHRLFSGCANEKLVVLDSETGHVVATAPIGAGVDGVVFDDKAQAATSADGESGTLTVVHEETPDRYRSETIKSARGARTIALDAATHRLYLPTADRGPAPAATEANPHPRPAITAGTFRVLEFGR